VKPLIDPINTDDGQFHGRDNQTGALATIVTPVYMNDTQGATRSLQQEVISVLTAAGIKPADATNDQLLSALKSLFLAGDDTRVSGALQKDKNLSDLKDAAESRGHLGLGKLAVLDSLSASDVGAYPQTGGNVNGYVSANYLGVTQVANPSVQGTFVGWNDSGGQGESDFVNNRGGGVGGFHFRTVNSDNTVQTGTVEFSGTGDVNSSGQISEAGQRVYSPNNCPFPVGYIMLLGNTSDPNNIFPGTTWQWLNGTGFDGKVIALGTDALQTGGSNTVTLAEAHMPPHRHNGGATGDASTQPDAGSAAWGTGRFGTDAKGGYSLMQTSAAGSGQAFSVQNEYVHVLGWMRTA